MAETAYRIGEVAEMLDLNASVLRYWEGEFPQLEPARTDKGQRRYTEEHVELLKLIKRLVHEEGLTIEGARKKLEQDAEVCRVSQLVVDELKQMRRLLVSGEVDKEGPAS